jgi:osmotically-inducible protein OsmY
MRILLGVVVGILIGLAIAHFWGLPLDWIGIGGETGVAVGDVAVTASVRAALALQKDFDLFGGIEVSTARGVVTLKGSVTDDEQRRLAGLIAQGIEGVREVVNDLELAGSDTEESR